MTRRTLLVSGICLALSLLVSRRCMANMRIVKLENFWQRVFWSIRVHRSKTTFPRTLEDWRLDNEDDPNRQFEQGMDAWMFLQPFFASRGYTLYDKPDVFAVMEPRPEPALAPADLRTYPYARTIPPDSHSGVRNNYTMICDKSSLWGARDTLGRDVVIKIISNADKPTDEWVILQRLNSLELRQDSANRTIYVIEFITFDNLIAQHFGTYQMFSWDCAFDPPFTTVSELMEVTKAYLEALEFLHEHRIAHLDIRMHNCGMNMFAGREASRASTVMRKPEDVRYIMYDFGYSSMYPADTDISSISDTRYLGFTHAPTPEGPYNPFKADVSMMAGLLFGFVMHAVEAVPEIEPFFYRMMDLDEDTRLTASEAVSEFVQIYRGLTVAQLRTPVDSRWTNNIQTKHAPDFRALWQQMYGHLDDEDEQ
ncbi:hypothetical protein D9619_005334 [Psilocybe cf. subviscida]|uniref:Protein kinase domain-containing protein n=1 Tax=Psilocybe cf. subviscida TaxID=2480587 RepID=A0A8H5BXE9_9AGAR|nr:hypothetical protein D9619_005334 [Psilocybe cf. subviscida]